ncbi:MAG TPA: Cys-tRNA(Pro) deacylase [Blastocatellia bacterium]|nr:Cys-tRNA(Pro) deacylase [Blastocatellia bacterium]
MKTNAARILDQFKIKYEIHEYEVDENDLSAESVAQKIGLPLPQVFKTLVARGDKVGVIMACVPSSGELDLKALASVSGAKHVDLVPVAEIQKLTGYIRGGVSPLGVKKKYPLFIDRTILNFPYISISAGMRGAQLYLSGSDLQKATGATLADLTKSSK